MARYVYLQSLHPLIAPPRRIGHNTSAVPPRGRIAGPERQIAIISNSRVAVITGVLGGTSQRERDGRFVRRLLLRVRQQENGAREFSGRGMG